MKIWRISCTFFNLDSLKWAILKMLLASLISWLIIAHIQTSTFGWTFNNFKFQFFVTNIDEIDPKQSFIKLEEFIQRIKGEAGEQFSMRLDQEVNPWHS
jgi:hypothetical protein